MHKTQYNPSAHICAFHLLHFILVITTPSVILRKKVIKTKGTGLWVHCIRGYVTQLKVLVNISEIGCRDAIRLLRGPAGQKVKSTMSGQLFQSLGQYRGLSSPCALPARECFLLSALAYLETVPEPGCLTYLSGDLGHTSIQMFCSCCHTR